MNRMITIIAAISNNGAIGKDGAIPWHIPEDFAMFQKETTGGAVVMGRRTWESLGCKPLKGRLNIVVSSRNVLYSDGVLSVTSIEDALHEAYKRTYTRVYLIGGAKIYEEGMKHADRVLLTRVDIEVDGADAHFPLYSLDIDMWQGQSFHLTDLATVHEYHRRR